MIIWTNPTLQTIEPALLIQHTVMTAPITISSLDNLHTHLPPSTPAEYVRYLLITTLQRKGFDSAEAGAIAEMEKLLEHRKSIYNNPSYNINEA